MAMNGEPRSPLSPPSLLCSVHMSSNCGTTSPRASANTGVPFADAFHATDSLLNLSPPELSVSVQPTIPATLPALSTIDVVRAPKPRCFGDMFRGGKLHREAEFSIWVLLIYHNTFREMFMQDLNKTNTIGKTHYFVPGVEGSLGDGVLGVHEAVLAPVVHDDRK